MTVKKIDKTFTEIKPSPLTNSSFLRMFNIMKEGDDYFLNIFKTFEIDPDILSSSESVDDYGVVDPWWENLAYTAYKDVDLWWIVCLANKVLNPYEELKEGDKITLLKTQYVPYVQRDMRRLFDL